MESNNIRTMELIGIDDWIGQFINVLKQETYIKI